MLYFDTLAQVRGKQIEVYKGLITQYEELLGVKDLEISKREQQARLNTALWKQNKQDLGICTAEKEKLQKKVKRKAFWGNTKFVLGIGVGVVGTILIMK